MRTKPTKTILTGCMLLLVGILGSCDALRDSEPFTVAVTYEQMDGGGSFAAVPPEIVADNSWGQIQVDNQTDCKRGFAIDDLAVYETIPARQVKTVSVDEAKDGRVYEFYDHCDDIGCDCDTKSGITGTVRVEYRPEEFR